MNGSTKVHVLYFRSTKVLSKVRNKVLSRTFVLSKVPSKVLSYFRTKVVVLSYIRKHIIAISVRVPYTKVPSKVNAS